MTALEELSKPADTLSNPSIDQWKEKGGKVIGYYCSYVPEEIIHAAGMLPYRMRATGSTSTELGDVYLSRLNCTFCRHSLDMAMKGKYDFIDGLVSLFSCDHIRRMVDVWRHGKVDMAGSQFYNHFLQVPIKVDNASIEWLEREIQKFRKSIEEHFGVKISDDDLSQSIKIYNEKRKLLNELYELRKQDSPPVTGAEVFRTMIASTALPLDEFNSLLTEMLKEIDGRNGHPDYKARLMLMGGELEDPAFFDTIEELGGLVVTDYLCYGTRDFWDLVDEDSDPVYALAKRYIERISCPRMIDHRRRFDFVRDMVRDYRVDGIIVQRLKYCDPWGVEGAMTFHDAKKEDIPFIVVEREHEVGANVGQLRTRVQAFLETLEG